MADQDRPRVRNAEALRELVADRYGLMVRYAAGHLGNYGVPRSSADPEDVVHNALVSVLDQDRPIRFIRQYTYTCIRREARRAARRYYKGKGYESLDADVRAEDEPVVLSFEEEVVQRDVIDKACEDLPLQQRRAFFLTHDLGMTHAQAGKVLGTATATISVHCSRAVRALRASLAGVGAALVAWVTASVVRGKQEMIPGAGPEMLPGSYMVATIVFFMAGLSSIVLAWAASASGRICLRSWLGPVAKALGILPEQGGREQHGGSDSGGAREQFVRALWAGSRPLARAASRYMRGVLRNRAVRR
ncbi:RNA polymerase sigma factor [Streptomyces sp. NPDC057382]|uniref:RNA polymerase sigma factor n=1 Tax=unclassified Streptomyces TaxID=2593676 RepID=UPI00363975ED